MSYSSLEALRAYTRPHHDAIEAGNFFVSRLMAQTATLAEYQRYLAKFYSYLEPLESQLDRFCLLSDWPARRKTGWLVSDLAALDAASDPVALPRCANLPEVTTPAQAWGVLYVLEGSTMGGQLLCRQVKTVFGPQVPVRYLTAYGSETGHLWNVFRQSLTQALPGPAPEATLAAAALTFTTLHAWLNRS